MNKFNKKLSKKTPIKTRGESYAVSPRQSATPLCYTVVSGVASYGVALDCHCIIQHMGNHVIMILSDIL